MSSNLLNSHLFLLGSKLPTGDSIHSNPPWPTRAQCPWYVVRRTQCLTRHFMVLPPAGTCRQRRLFHILTPTRASASVPQGCSLTSAKSGQIIFINSSVSAPREGSFMNFHDFEASRFQLPCVASRRMASSNNAGSRSVVFIPDRPLCRIRPLRRQPSLNLPDDLVGGGVKD